MNSLAKTDRAHCPVPDNSPAVSTPDRQARAATAAYPASSTATPVRRADAVCSPPARRWLTTVDAARMLAVSTEGVIWLANNNRLPVYDRTTSGQRLFRLGDVLRLVEQRAKARLMGTRPVVVGRSGEPRQLSLFGKARLRLVDGERRSA